MDFSTNEKSKRIYRSSLNYEEAVLLAKIREISLWRDTNSKAYQSGVQTLALLLPSFLRQKTLGWWKHGTVHEDLSGDGKVDFDDLFVYILKLLEDHDICFPKVRYHEGVV